MIKVSLFLTAGIAFLFGANALAQDNTPTTFEIGVDYSLAHFIPALPGSRSHNLNGGGGSIVFYTPAKWLGIKMDLQGYGSKTSAIGIPVGTTLFPGGGTVTVQGNLFTYMFGPVIKKRGKIEPFGEVLVGGAYTNLYGHLLTASGIVGTMTSSKFHLAVVVCSMTLMLAPAIVRSQSPTMEQRVAALKQSVARDQQNIRQYEWIETTVISLKGEEKSRQQKQCYYGAEGSLQKVDVSSSPPPEKKRGMRGRIVENKKEELTDYMKQAVALLKSYVPPDPARIQAVKDAGKVSLDLPGGGKGARVNLRDYAKPGDVLSVEVDPASNRVMGLTVATYLDDAKDAVTLDVRFSALEDGTGYPATEVLLANAKNLSVNVTNSGYRKSAH